MNCMRCGKKTTGSDVFCAECLVEMERYPVKPGTVIHIPTRQAAEPRRQPRRKKEPSIEGQLARMRQLVQFLVACVIAMATTLAVMTGVLFYSLFQPQEEPPAPVSRNYSTSVPTEGD